MLSKKAASRNSCEDPDARNSLKLHNKIKNSKASVVYTDPITQAQVLHYFNKVNVETGKVLPVESSKGL